MSNARFAKDLVWVCGSVPGVLLAWDAWRHELGANPVNFAIRTTGLLSILFLTGSLLVTPVRTLTGFEPLFPHRRTLGLHAAFYAFAHFLIFFWWDRGRSVASTLHEIASRQYIWYGLAALLIFVPLTATSTRGMIRRLGPARWKLLHRLVYLAAVGGAVHYLLLNKVVAAQAIVFASLLGALIAFRPAAGYVSLRAAYAKLRGAHSSAATPAKPRYWTGTLRLAQVFRETPDVRTFRFVALDGGQLPFVYLPGQYLNLTLHVDGKRVTRSYTLASSPTRLASCEITVKREASGVSSRHLHDVLKPGDTVHVSAPAGRFIFTGRDADSVVLICGGVGVTPLMSKVRYLTDLAWPGDIFFVFVGRTERDIIFADELALLQKRHPNLLVTTTLTRAGPNWPGERGRLNSQSLARFVPELPSREVHVCGPDAMADATRALLAELGVPPDKAHFESFTPPARGDDGVHEPAVLEPPVSDNAAASNSGGPASLTFARSGRSVDSPDGQTILELAEANGIAIDFDCRAGICGTCKVKKLAGRVEMPVQDALTRADRAAGMVLSCQAVCRDAVVVDV